MTNVLVKSIIKTFKKDEVIFQEGESGNAMYVIQSGSVKICKMVDGKEVHLETFGPKDFFGEMALFGVRKRTGTTWTLAEIKVLIITKPMLDTQLTQVPKWFMVMLTALIDRLKKTSERLHPEQE